VCLAVPGKITSVLEDTSPMRRGKVDFGGVAKEVNLALVPGAEIGDYVLVHVGFAIATIDEAEAERVFEYLRKIDELGELRDGVT
jgi:hydrogenase expression/formation protein HypC